MGDEMACGRKSAGKSDVGNASVGGEQKSFRFVDPYEIQVIGKASADDLFKGCGKMVVAESAKFGNLFKRCDLVVFGYVDQGFLYGFGHYRLGLKLVFLVPIAEDSRKYSQNIRANYQLVCR